MSHYYQRFILNLILISCLMGCGPGATPASTQAPTLAPTQTPTSAPTQEPTPSPAPPDPLAVSVDTYLGDLAKSNNFSGAVLVAKEGKIILSKAYGLANFEQKKPFTTQISFPIFFMSGQFTATAILMLQQAGKLNVQDSICLYIKDCPEAWKAITIHHLLSHTSGLPNYTNADIAKKDVRMTPTELVEWYKPRPLDSKPGDMFSFSMLDYNLLGYIIENVSGKSYGAFLREAIFDPLQMADSGYDPDWKSQVVFYTSYGIPDTFTVDTSFNFSTAGIYSSMEDLYRWDQALYTEKLLRTKLMEEEFKTQASPSTSYGETYGYGWWLSHYKGRRFTVHFTGDNYDMAGIWRFPDDRATVILFCNDESVSLLNTGLHIFAKLFP